MVVRPCDARALNLLLHEGQIERDNVKVIGLTCAGTEVHGAPRLTCQFCQERVPVIYDVLIESEAPIEASKAASPVLSRDDEAVLFETSDIMTSGI